MKKNLVFRFLERGIVMYAFTNSGTAPEICYRMLAGCINGMIRFFGDLEAEHGDICNKCGKHY